MYMLYTKQFKRIATEFFFWWYNSKGANTYGGFDEWCITREGKTILENMEKDIEYEQQTKRLSAFMLGIICGILSVAAGYFLFKLIH
jgi:hypothetical protein